MACVAKVEPVVIDMALDVEQVDLAALAAELSRTFQNSAPRGFIRGRTVIREAVIAGLGCSEAEAERLVETMIGRGFLRFTGDPSAATTADAIWSVGGVG